MSRERASRPYLDPHLAGAMLGVVLFLSFFITGGGLGASAALSHLQTAVLDGLAPSHVDRVAYFAEIAGGSKSALRHTGVYMLLGTALGGLLSGLYHGRTRLGTNKGPRVSTHARWALALVGGLIMGYGARLARGCTSGQALSGGAVLSVGSWAFMFSIFAGGYAVAWFARKLWV